MTPDGVVIRTVDRAVYRAVMGFYVLTYQYIVNTKIELVLIVRDAQSAPRLGKGVFELLCYDPVCIGDGAVVEIATNDN